MDFNQQLAAKRMQRQNDKIIFYGLLSMLLAATITYLLK